MGKGDRTVPAKDTERFPDYHPEGYDDHTATTSWGTPGVTWADKDVRSVHQPKTPYVDDRSFYERQFHDVNK